MKSKDFFKYDVVVIGAGHSGCEAALASARNGARTMILSINMDSVAAMNFGNDLGGPGQTTLLKEIDVLGGEISKNADRNFLNMKMIGKPDEGDDKNLKIIVDRRRYSMNMKSVLENQEYLDTRQGLAAGIQITSKGFEVIASDGITYQCKCVVISTGTFLRANIFWGRYRREAGRQGEISSKKLAVNLKDLGFKFDRMAVYSAPRIDKKSINTEKLETASSGKEYDGINRGDYYITYVGDKCNEYILNYVGSYGKSEMIEGKGDPLEKKSFESAKEKRYPVYIQPEGRDTNEMYLDGFATALAEELQIEAIRKLEGLKDANITRPGCGVEYDSLSPSQASNYLESKKYPGLFFAGQINGTTGYEESAAQGLVAGINASRKIYGLGRIKFKKEDGFIGVLTDYIANRKSNISYSIANEASKYQEKYRPDNTEKRMSKYLKVIGKNCDR